MVGSVVNDLGWLFGQGSVDRRFAWPGVVARQSRSRVGPVRLGRVPSEGSERQCAVRRSRCSGRSMDGCLAQSRQRERGADQAGWTATMVSDVSEDSTRLAAAAAAAAAAATRAGMCLM